MASPYSSQPISNYNSNPPADDGSAVSTNQMKWSGVKTKLADPVKTRTDSMDSALVTAFTKTLGGGGITSISTDYTVQSSDQGKLIKATASLTMTLGDATTFLAPFCHGFVNLSGTTVTVQGGGGQTIDGNTSISIPPQAGFLAFTDGANWNTTGLAGTLLGKQLAYASVVNGTIVQSNSSNAVTFSLKTLSGNDPSSTDPVLFCFRNSTVGTGNYVYRAVTAATSVVVSAGSTLGTSNSTACRIWIGALDNAGTVELFVINCLSGTNIYPLGQFPVISTTAEGGLGAADSAQVAYSTSARTSKAYLVLGYADYYGASLISTAGNWNVAPLRIQLYGSGVPLPGQRIQVQRNYTGAVATGTTTIPYDDTIPQNTEGDQFLSQAITPTSAANILDVRAELVMTQASTSDRLAMALFQDSTASALAVKQTTHISSGLETINMLSWSLLAGTTSSTTLKIRAGSTGLGTLTINGEAGSRKYGGAYASFISVEEVMA